MRSSSGVGITNDTGFRGDLYVAAVELESPMTRALEVICA